MPPGTSFSWDEGGGASEATVEVKELSRCRSEDMRALRRDSAVVDCACRKRRVVRMWVARRSVGVEPGERVGVEGVSGLEGLYFGILTAGGRVS